MRRVINILAISPLTELISIGIAAMLTMLLWRVLLVIEKVCV